MNKLFSFVAASLIVCTTAPVCFAADDDDDLVVPVAAPTFPTVEQQVAQLDDRIAKLEKKVSRLVAILKLIRENKASGSNATLTKNAK
jgi:hypothetical protein